MPQMTLDDIAVDVVLKDIKNVHLSVYPPEGRVRISAPQRMSMETIRVFAISKLGWIRQQQKKLREQERETHRDYVDRESHYVWGRRYLLRVIEENVAPRVQLTHGTMLLCVRPGTGKEARAETLAGWYRQLLRAATEPLVENWTPRLEVEVVGFHVRQMKTKWGSCTPKARTIRLNTELAKKPTECLEYVLVHEMVHLLESTHNARFVALMDRFLPTWRETRNLLNSLPARHEEWGY